MQPNNQDNLGFEYQRFTHKAMATLFEVFITEQEAHYARQATAEAFALLDRVEQQLSRFIENSDITRLNMAPVNHEVLLSLEAFACLSRALEMRGITQGAFDVTMGTLTAQKFHDSPEEKPYGLPISAPALHPDDAELLKLDEEALTATRLVADVQIDLGGIGKGFVLDRMAELLRQWGIERVLLHGGTSSVLALDGPAADTPWPLTMSCPHDRAKTIVHVPLTGCALGGSSQIDQKHIIDPHTGRLTFKRIAAWSHARDGATADALSTAFMIMPEPAIVELCAGHPDMGAAISCSEFPHLRPCKIKTIGHWPDHTPQVWCKCRV